MNEIELIELAKKAAMRSYSPYSNCRVGAALICKNGKIYTGCNIENASFSPTMCAERVAFGKAISDGESVFEAVAVFGEKDGQIVDDFTPCGVCRQVMSEFCSSDFKIFVASSKGYDAYTLQDLLPYSFTKDKVRG